MALNLYNIRQFKSRYKSRSIPCILFWAGMAKLHPYDGGWCQVSCAVRHARTCQLLLELTANRDSQAEWLVWVLIADFAQHFLNQRLTEAFVLLPCPASRYCLDRGKCANTNPCHSSEAEARTDTAFSAFSLAVPWLCWATEPGVPCSSLTTLVQPGHWNRKQCFSVVCAFWQVP